MVRQRCGHTCVDDNQTDAHIPRHDVDRRAARQEVVHHLRRDLLGVGGDALRHDAMVSSGHNDCLATGLGAFGAEYARELYGQRFQAAQAAGRFGQTVLSKPGRPLGLLVGGCDAPDDFVKGHHQNSIPRWALMPLSW